MKCGHGLIPGLGKGLLGRRAACWAQKEALWKTQKYSLQVGFLVLYINNPPRAIADKYVAILVPDSLSPCRHASGEHKGDCKLGEPSPWVN